MKTKEEVQKWLDVHTINDATVVAVDKWLSIHEYNDMEFSISPDGDVTFIDLLDFCNGEPEIKYKLEDIVSDMQSAIRTLQRACLEINELKKNL